MNPQDIIVTALTPGSPFNEKGLIYRSVESLSAIVGLPTGEIMGLLAGDLAGMVSCKPSKKGKGLLVALKANLPPAQPQPALVGVAVHEAPLGHPAGIPGFGYVGGQINAVPVAGQPMPLQEKLEAVFADDIDEADEF